MLQQFRDNHDRLRGLMSELLTVLDPKSDPAVEDVMRIRKELSRTFRSHFQRECTVLSDLRRANTNPLVEQRLDQHNRLFSPIFLNYSHVINHWTPARIEANWSEYCRIAREMIGRYRDWLDWVEQAVHPLLAGNGQGALALMPLAQPLHFAGRHPE